MSLCGKKNKFRPFFSQLLIVTTTTITACIIVIVVYQHFANGSHWLKKDSTNSDYGIMGLQEYNYLRLRNPKTDNIPEGIFKKELEFAKTLPTVESIKYLNKSQKIYEFGWKPRGPYNVGGRTNAVGIDILDENIINAGAATGGIWKSTNKGESWIKRTKPEDLHSATCLIQDIRAGKENTWYSGTGEYIGTGGEKSRIIGNSPVRGDGIYKSTDNGDTWNLLPATSTEHPESQDQDFDHVWNLAIDLTNVEQDEIYAAVFGSIHRSVDGGVTWNRVLGGLNVASAYTDVQVSSTGIVYATLCKGTARGVWRSEDGINWTKISPVSWPSYTNRITIAIAPSNENVIYFLADLSTDWIEQKHKFWKYTFISGDGSGDGGVWEDRSGNIPSNLNSQFSFCLVNKVHPNNEDIVFIGGVKLYRSMDGFLSQNYFVIGGTDILPNNHVDQHSLIFSYKNPEVAYLGNDGGVNITKNIKALPMRWSSLNNGYQTTQFYTVAIVPDVKHDAKIMGGLQDNGTYFTDNQNPSKYWKLISYGDGGFAAFLEDGNKQITSWQDGEIFISSLSYTYPHNNRPILTRINPEFSTRKIFFCPFVPDPNDESIIYLAGSRILYRCDNIKAIPLDGSQNNKSEYWNSLSSFPYRVSALAISKTPPNVLYAGTLGGSIYRIENADSTTPLKKRVDKGLPRNAYVSSIAVDQQEADQVMVTFSNYETKSVYSTTDGGETWVDVSGNIEEYPNGSGSGPSVRWVAILNQNESNTYFIGTSTGLYSTNSLDGANTVWAQEGSSTIGNVVVDMVVTREIDGNVVVATHGNGIYSRDLSVLVDDVDSELPTDFTIFQNYPNPFNPSTKIRFSIPTVQEVKIDIFNMTGQKIQTLEDQQFPAGIHEIPFEAGNLPSGVYLYRIKAGNITKTGKMMIVM